LVDIIAALGEGLRAHKSGGRCDVERWSKPVAQGVYVGQRLSFGDPGKARLQTVAKVANRTREIRPSGMKTGARGNVAMVELGSHPATERAGVVTSTYRCARPGSIQTGAADKATIQQVRVLPC